MGPKSDQALILSFKRPKAKNYYFSNRILINFEILGSKLGAKFDQKTIKKWSRKWSASWHRFLIDFGGFRGPTWGGKSIKIRSKKASKKRWKKEGHQNRKNVASRGPNTVRRSRSRPRGGTHPFLSYRTRLWLCRHRNAQNDMNASFCSQCAQAKMSKMATKQWDSWRPNRSSRSDYTPRPSSRPSAPVCIVTPRARDHRRAQLGSDPFQIDIVINEKS